MTRPGRATLARLGAAAAAGVLLGLSRPPADIGWLACIGLVPLFVAWRGQSARATAGYAFTAGVVYYTIVCSWVWYFGAVAVVPFILAVAGYWALAGAVIGWLSTRRVSSPWITAAVWVSADALVARFPLGGFSWGELGYSFHDLAPARAAASVGGVTLVTYLAVALNALIADLVAGERSARSRARANAGIAIVVVAVVGATVTRAEPHAVSTLRVALVQGNDKDRDLTDAELAARYLPNSHFDLARRITDPVDLIVFPESSMDGDPRTDPFIHDHLAAIARQHQAWVLANATVDAPPDGHRAANLDVLYAPDGTVAGTYLKHHLVPFGEYVPLRAELQGWISELDKVPRDFEPGNTRGIFPVAGTKIGTLICFESAFGYQVRPVVRAGAQILVVSTNNRSYRRSGNSAQHLAIGQMRAAETGRPVIQAAISGITAVIDADGVVHDQTRLFDRTVVETAVTATSGETPYVRYGEWATIAALIVVAIAAGVALTRRRRMPSVDLATEHDTAPIAPSLAGYDAEGAAGAVARESRNPESRSQEPSSQA
ncbi:MAG TPA: apolipoprotein N-acyltransferase [Acidimicrobiia bacterium]|nr:apolipoprotein N-acyltransferase [Acidimicrobiia bacterium]